MNRLLSWFTSWTFRRTWPAIDQRRTVDGVLGRQYHEYWSGR